MTQRLTLVTLICALAALLLVADRAISGAVQCASAGSCPR